MKTIIIFISTLLVFTSCANLDQVLQQSGVLTGALGADPTQTEIIAGLKQALSKGINTGANQVSQVNGFFSNPLIKIPFPKEAQKVESGLRSLGLSSLADKVILTMNRAAEDASKKAIPIFTQAITSMTIQDAMNILVGNNPKAATDYLQKTTTSALTANFKPVITQSLNKVDATKYWAQAIGQYNKIPLVKPINTNLTSYVTDLALTGLFKEVAQEEAKIRANPIERTTSLLKKVFGYADSKK